MSLFDDLFDDFFDWFWFGGEDEEVKKAREKLRKAREEYYEARQKAWEKRMEELKKVSKSMSKSKELALPSTTLIPFSGSEEEFQAAVERFARAHPDARVEAKSITFPNGYYRSVRIEKKR